MHKSIDGILYLNPTKVKECKLRKFIRGQRWISETESELGLGKVVQADDRRVEIHFPAADVVRTYSAALAPLQRVRFQPGERVSDSSGASLVITKVTEADNLITYHGEDREINETQLSDQMAFSTPKNRLGAGQFDPPELFDLRTLVIQMQHRMRQSPVRGFVGTRIDLYPHQIYIAHEAAGRMMPRLLLSDETGLGKTIEACLILHRLILCGRVQRALIVVPDALVYQWFVELFRKFNLSFQVMDESHCQAVENDAPDNNPFLSDQLILSSTQFLVQTANRGEQAVRAPWDMVIMDEAHHIKENSQAYVLASDLAQKTPRLMLLTATPEQLGLRSHFARLRLLDPSRYHDYDTYLEETERYQPIAKVAQRIADKKQLTRTQEKLLASLVPDAIQDKDIRKLSEDDSLSTDLLDRIIDRYGTGRVIRRNTRSAVKGFSSRRARLIPLDIEEKDNTHLIALSEIFRTEHWDGNDPPDPEFLRDGRVGWLAGLIRELKDEKILLICSSVSKVKALHQALVHQINADVAVFHEEMTLLQRDRSAAWFSQEEGAVALICSEIGSEGRNFQFAHHLVLFDLPLNPELLEQRIGRLDRIGQKSVITIHVPYLKYSPQHVLAEWYHRSLDSFQTQLMGGLQILETFGGKVAELAITFHASGTKGEDALEDLIAETKIFKKNLSARLAKGRNRLLEISSFRPREADKVVRAIRAIDADLSLDDFMSRIWDHFGVETDNIGPRTIVLKPGVRFDENFPLKSSAPTAVTFDRNTAVHREELGFISWDHPMVSDAMALLLGSSIGNCSVCIHQGEGVKGAIMEAIFVLECVAPAKLDADRFLAPTPIQVAFNQRLEPIRPPARHELMPAPSGILDKIHELLGSMTGDMLTACWRAVERKKTAVIRAAVKKMETMLGEELQRLVDLKKINPDIHSQEIVALENEKNELGKHIARARVRLDALRLILCVA